MRGRAASLLSEVGCKVAFQIMKALITLHFNQFNGNFSIMDSVHPCLLKIALPKWIWTFDDLGYPGVASVIALLFTVAISPGPLTCTLNGLTLSVQIPFPGLIIKFHLIQILLPTANLYWIADCPFVLHSLFSFLIYCFYAAEQLASPCDQAW